MTISQSVPYLALDLNETRAIETLRTMVRCDTRTMTPSESDLTHWLVDAMQSMGMQAHVQRFDAGRANAIGVWKGSGGGQSLMFNGHVDTNPLTQGWTVDPWGAEIHDGYLFGLGVSNMKAGCASYLEAVRTLLESGYTPKGDVILTFVVGELQGGAGTRALIDAGYRADHFINCEPTDLSALTAHAGAITFTVNLRGDTRHLSKREDAGDALAAAAAVAPIINNFIVPGAGDVDEAVGRSHVGVLRAGLGEELLDTRPPQVADRATLRGSLRYGTSTGAIAALAALRNLVEEVCAGFPGVIADVDCDEDLSGTNDAAFSVPQDSPIVKAVNAAYEAVRGVPQPTGALRPYCYYGSDASLLQSRAAMSGVVCGPGGKYNTMPDERVELRDYIDMIGIHTRTIQTICS